MYYMISKNDISFSVLVGKTIRIITQNSEIDGLILFESLNQLIIFNSKTDSKIKVLKSSINELYFYEENLEKFVLVNKDLIQGTLVSRIKKMK